MFEKYEQWAREAERAAVSLQEQADDQRKRSHRFRGQGPLWEQILIMHGDRPLRELEHLPSAVADKFEAAGMSDLRSVLLFWLGATWKERAVIGLTGPKQENLGVALTFLFNQSAPPDLRNPRIPGYRREEWS